MINEGTDDQHEMHTNPNQSILYPADIGIYLNAELADIIAKRLNKETISNLSTFITSFLERLLDERGELAERIEKLKLFINFKYK